MLEFLMRFKILMSIKIAQLVQEFWHFSCMSGFYLFMELRQKGFAPAACAVGFIFFYYIYKKKYISDLRWIKPLIIDPPSVSFTVDLPFSLF